MASPPHLCHEPEVQDAELPLGGAQQVAWVRVCVQEAGVQQLQQVGVEREGHQAVHVRGGAVGQLLAVDPLGGQDLTGGGGGGGECV